jgi:two-component system, response regulator YesN
MKTRVVIIDDEAFVRRGIITSIPWEEHNIDVVGEQSDGKSGLKLIRESNPNIVITDIRMPNMDGLEMIQHIRSEFPDIKILVLSVLEDFSTLREALRLGVDDYINKLTEPEELLERVLRLKNEIVMSQEGIYKPEENTSFSNDLEKWLQGDSIVRYDSFLSERDRYLVGKIRTIKSASSTASLLPQLPDSLLVDMIFEYKKDNDFVFIMRSTEEQNLKKAIQYIEQYSGDSVIGISKTFGKGSNRSKALDQAVQALESSFYNEKEKILVYDGSLDLHLNRRSLFEYSQLKEYHSFLESGELEESLKALEKLFPETTQIMIPPRTVRDDVNQWLSANIALLRDWGGHLQETLQHQSPYEQIQKFKTYSELRQWCFQLHSVMTEMIQSLKSSRSRIEIPQAMDYIRKHYQSPLRVQEVARAVNLSENYFSNLFTKETGVTFTQFVQDTRIEKAKELLRNPEYKWYEVGEKVGLEDPKYFSKVFKKVVGITPVRFKQGG